MQIVYVLESRRDERLIDLREAPSNSRFHARTIGGTRNQQQVDSLIREQHLDAENVGLLVDAMKYGNAVDEDALAKLDDVVDAAGQLVEFVNVAVSPAACATDRVANTVANQWCVAIVQRGHQQRLL